MTVKKGTLGSLSSETEKWIRRGRPAKGSQRDQSGLGMGTSACHWRSRWACDSKIRRSQPLSPQPHGASLCFCPTCCSKARSVLSPGFSILPLDFQKGLSWFSISPFPKSPRLTKGASASLLN